MTEETFEQVVRRYGDMLYRVAFHALRNRADAEDVTQTVLLRLYQQGGRFDSEEHRKHWLLRVAVNESRRLLRSAWRRRSVPLEEWPVPPAEEEPRKADRLQALQALAPQYRLTIYHYYYEGCSVKEVAAALRAKESTVQTWLQRARDRLRRTLSGDGEEEEGSSYV